MNFRLSLAFVFFLLGMGGLEAQPSTVVVIGGGPTGLGAAIEARTIGANVILVEKREQYTRQNTLFLYTATLELFEKWNAPIPQIEELDFKGERRGFVLIKDLEESLAFLADKLGVQRIHGEFLDFAEDSHAAIIQIERGQEQLFYDVLVGADGHKSKVREKMGIACHSFGESIGGISILSATNPDGKIIVEIQPHAEVFAKKVSVPTATVLFIQSHPNTLIDINLKEMTRLVADVGWQEEAKKMEEGSCVTMENVPIYLQRASAFSDPSKGVILLGDAAGTASFFSGSGVNFSFKMTQIAGILFQNLQQENAYEQFDRDMEIEVEKLIKISLPLFE